MPYIKLNDSQVNLVVDMLIVELEGLQSQYKDEDDDELRHDLLQSIGLVLETVKQFNPGLAKSLLDETVDLCKRQDD